MPRRIARGWCQNAPDAALPSGEPDFVVDSVPPPFANVAAPHDGQWSPVLDPASAHTQGWPERRQVTAHGVALLRRRGTNRRALAQAARAVGGGAGGTGCERIHCASPATMQILRLGTVNLRPDTGTALRRPEWHIVC
jgi:hypothetical protein